MPYVNSLMRKPQLNLLYMEPTGLHIKDVANLLAVDRKTVSRLVNKRTGVTVEMAIRLAKTFRTSEKLWLGLQQSYDIWHAKQEHKVDLSTVKYFCPDKDMGITY